MASESQKKIIGIVRDLITAHGFEPLAREAWANTGTIAIEHSGRFGQLAEITYNFQDDYFTLTIRRTRTGAKDSRHYMRYDERGKFAIFTSELVEMLKTLKPGNQEAAS